MLCLQRPGPAPRWAPAVPLSPAALGREAPLSAPVPELPAQWRVNQAGSKHLSLGDRGTSPETPTKQKVNLKLRALLPRARLSLALPPRSPFCAKPDIYSSVWRSQGAAVGAVQGQRGRGGRPCSAPPSHHGHRPGCARSCTGKATQPQPSQGTHRKAHPGNTAWWYRRSPSSHCTPLGLI